MPAYLLAVLDVHNAEGIKAYQARVPDVVAQFGGRYLARGGEHTVYEGNPPGSRFVVIEFPDRAAADRFYQSPEYQEIIESRTQNSTGYLAVVDGV